MISGYDLQDIAMKKDQLRIDCRRNANEERRIRFLNAPKRLIGVDSQALDYQIAETRQNRDNFKEADRMEKLRNNEIQSILESAIEEERFMKQHQMEELKKSWHMSKMEKAAIRPDQHELDRAKCGMASAQNFGGEDLNKFDREKLKQEDMRRWVKERISHKEYMKMCEEEEDMNYAALLQKINIIRGEAEAEESDMRRYLNNNVREENAALAAEHKQKNKKEITSKSQPTSLNLFNEDVYAAMDSNGHIIRKDMFKGFTPAQNRRIMQENELILMQKREKEEDDRALESQYVRQQIMIQRALEDANQQELLMKEEEKMYHLAVLREQAYNVAMEKIKYKREQQEQPGRSGFYDGFGKSCR